MDKERFPLFLKNRMQNEAFLLEKFIKAGLIIKSKTPTQAIKKNIFGILTNKKSEENTEESNEPQ